MQNPVGNPVLGEGEPYPLQFKWTTKGTFPTSPN